MTSFKSAQLIANSKDADKVIFLMDRIELGTQSLQEYRAFADASDDVQATENTGVLVTKLKSNDPANTLIVTSIQKMSNINSEEDGLKSKDIELISNKRIVFIVDECHRSTFGDMLITIKDTFTNAIFFGFTGTPIQDENQKKDNTTATEVSSIAFFSVSSACSSSVFSSILNNFFRPRPQTSWRCPFITMAYS
jgi:type I restriction enzyme R subunit